MLLGKSTVRFVKLSTKTSRFSHLCSTSRLSALKIEISELSFISSFLKNTNNIFLNRMQSEKRITAEDLEMSISGFNLKK